MTLRGQTKLVDGFTLTVPGNVCLDFARHVREEFRKNPDDQLLGIQLGESAQDAWTWSHLDVERVK